MTYILVRLLPLIAVMNACLFTGMYFISGQLAPVLLSRVYASVGMGWRTAIASVTLFAFANLLGGGAMARFPPSIVGPCMIVCYVLGMVLSTVLVMGYRPSFWIVPATFMVMVGCAWVSLLLLKG
jgi:hypothetical protein